MPLLGLGVYKLPDDVQAEAAITSAISAGYRMIDTASVYKNEESVGRAIARCGVPRKDLFITSKIWNTAQRLGDVHIKTDFLFKGGIQFNFQLLLFPAVLTV